MNDIVRNRNDQQGYSPKSSPARGSRSPSVVPRQDSTGTLKTTISLGKTPTIVHSGPFYLLKPEAPVESALTGSANLIDHHNLQHSYYKFCSGKKLKESLSSFLPNLPGNIDIPAAGPTDMSSLRSLIDRPPICGKELLPLTPSQLTGFRLHPGPLPEQYRVMSLTATSSSSRKKHKKDKKNRSSGSSKSSSQPTGDHHSISSVAVDHHHHHNNPDYHHQYQMENQTASLPPSSLTQSSISSSKTDDKRHDKRKRKHEDEKERKKKKKEKKRKKEKYGEGSSIPTSVSTSGPSGSSGIPSSSGLMSDRSV